jgi:hypothetical protein
MTNSSWREESRKVIQTVMDQNPGLETAELKKLISAAYPFGERKHWPYQCWLSEVREALKPAPQPEPTPEEIRNYWVKS